MTLYAIGDVQGCAQKLSELLYKISDAPVTQKWVFVGDLINRGPDSLGTLRMIRQLGDAATVILGNHDLHLLAVSQGIRSTHVLDTFEDILNAPDREEHLDWLRHQPLAHFENNHLFVHAGVLPQWSVVQTLARAKEIETALQGPDWVSHLRAMYGNTPNQWSDTLVGPDRLRCIINVLTRLRFCTPDGAMEFVTKENAAAALPGYVPWFDIPERTIQTSTVVFGHWSSLGLVMRPNLIGLDTGCVWGGQLTAVRLHDRALFQIGCPAYQGLS